MRQDKIDGEQNANKEQDQKGRRDKTGKSSVRAKQVVSDKAQRFGGQDRRPQLAGCLCYSQATQLRLCVDSQFFNTSISSMSTSPFWECSKFEQIGHAW
jgi:hypothetical protein